MDYKTKLRTLEDEAAKKALQQATMTDTQKWYARDKTKSIQSEVIQALFQHQEALAQ
jgi:hypothetical protein